ncbi:hypothetical protein [uncultured Rothia sp.]|uniref:hypothetical protein n=1 Tax=uncultured Rothia sp. TaxID=316088 RepID=UPI003216BE35
MNPNQETESSPENDDDFVALSTFEKELEIILALDPVERIRHFEKINQNLEQELDDAQSNSEI